MAGRALHPPPTPVKLSPKVAKPIAIEACLDLDHEGLYQDDPAELIAAYDAAGEDVYYIRVLVAGKLTEAWAVLRTQKALWKERDKIAEQIGQEVLGLDTEDRDVADAPQRRREAKKKIKKLRRQAKRIRAAGRECSRFWNECREYDKDQEAAKRLGLGGGGEG
jgi:hypothetical protein